jgi:hypothetical protein
VKSTTNVDAPYLLLTIDREGFSLPYDVKPWGGCMHPAVLYDYPASGIKGSRALWRFHFSHIPLIVYFFHTWECFPALRRRTTCGKCIFFRKIVRSGLR